MFECTSKHLPCFNCKTRKPTHTRMRPGVEAIATTFNVNASVSVEAGATLPWEGRGILYISYVVPQAIFSLAW